MPGMHIARADADASAPKGIRRDDASHARPKKASGADSTTVPPQLARARTTPCVGAGGPSAAPAPAPTVAADAPIVDLEGLRRHVDRRLDALGAEVQHAAEYL